MAKVIKKTSKSRQKKTTIDVPNVDAVMEEVKKLALQKQVDDINVKEDKTDVKDEKEEVALVKSVEEEKNVREQIDDIDEKITEEVIPVEEDNNEDVSFIDEITSGIDSCDSSDTETVEEPQNFENKPKRKTYDEMFGHTWCGYGYTIK